MPVGPPVSVILAPAIIDVTTPVITEPLAPVKVVTTPTIAEPSAPVRDVTTPVRFEPSP